MNRPQSRARRAVAGGLVLAALAATPAFALAPWVHSSAQTGDFPLVAEHRAATLVVAPSDEKVVSLAAADLAADLERVTGTKPDLTATPLENGGPLVLIGTLGRNPLLDALVAQQRIDVSGLKGAWESFLVATVDTPWPNAPRALVVIGSDRRGTAFGVYELSRAIGVSPWHWWADVVPDRQPALYVAAGTRRFGPPSVQYRGIFLNDEDWGLQPWAAKTFEPEHGGIGPKTYQKLFELLLRLKANTLWPAMHPTTKPFNRFSEDARLADEYAIVMGSSHAEPMLRDNVGEWKEPPQRYNYVTNREGVRGYWEERMRTNGQFENIYTIGMRGVHDSGIQGAKTDAERVQVLEQVFADQRDLIAKWARYDKTGRRLPDGAADPAAVPQMFCAYKEVLGLYRQGLKVPEDATVVWPDDNFGYLREFATPEELKRPGGFGVYYHLSYLGAPLAYLWLYTTPPALVWEELSKAYARGARTIWIANVGDLKPGEIGTEFFLDLAWDIDAFGPDAQPRFLRAWAEREFGAAPADAIAAVLMEYYRLNGQRKPEHLQWWLPKETPHRSPLTRAEIADRLDRFRALRERTAAIATGLPADKRTSFFELVEYPVTGAALANDRYFYGELAAAEPGTTDASKALSDHAMAADAALKALTARYNDTNAGGKWRDVLALEPADNQWRSFRIAPWTLPSGAGWERPADEPAAAATTAVIALDAGHFTAARDGEYGHWVVVPGLGRTGAAITAVPATMPAVAIGRTAQEAARVEYRVRFPAAGRFVATFYLVPTQPIVARRGLRFAVALDDQPPTDVVLHVRDGSADWAQGVLNATRTVASTLEVPAAGPHVLRVYATDAGVVLDKIVIDLGGLKPSYLGPMETPAPAP